jgi:hypothetical protein
MTIAFVVIVIIAKAEIMHEIYDILLQTFVSRAIYSIRWAATTIYSVACKTSKT